MTNTEDDAWRQHLDLLDRFTTEVEVRADLSVTAHACDRAVEVAIAEIDGSKRPYDLRRFTWQSTGPRNVGTMRELAQAIIDACDFVDQANPEWAGTNVRLRDEPIVVIRP